MPGAKISHDRAEESELAKARWFQSLSVEERMERLCEFTDLALELNPRLLEIKRAQPAGKRARVISLPSS